MVRPEAEINNHENGLFVPGLLLPIVEIIDPMRHLPVESANRTQSGHSVRRLYPQSCHGSAEYHPASI